MASSVVGNGLKASERAWAIAFGIADLVAAVFVVVGVFVMLPARDGRVDGGAVVVAIVLGVAGLGLLGKLPWGMAAARLASASVLVVGLALVTALAFAASYVSGIYDQVGRGGALILMLVAALVLPYLVLLPAAQLLWASVRTNKVGS